MVVRERLELSTSGLWAPILWSEENHWKF